MKKIFLLLFFAYGLGPFALKADSSCDCLNSSSDVNNYITQNNSVSLVLDTLYLGLNENKPVPYYLLTTIHGYSTDQMGNSTEEIFQSVLLEKTVSAQNNMAVLSDVRLISAFSLEGIDQIRMEIQLVKKNTQADGELLKMLGSLTGQVLSKFNPALGVVTSLLKMQRVKDANDSNYVFIHDFFIPQNSVNYEASIKDNTKFLLVNNEKIGISINAAGSAPILRESKTTSFLGQITKTVAEIVPVSDPLMQKVMIRGLMVAHFDAHYYSKLPPEITSQINLIIQEMNNDQFGKAADHLDELNSLNAFYAATAQRMAASDLFINKRTSIVIESFKQLAEAYSNFRGFTGNPNAPDSLMSESDMLDITTIRNKYKSFERFAKNFGKDDFTVCTCTFKSRNGKDCQLSVYKPLHVDEGILNTFVDWQKDILSLIAQ